MNVDGTLNDKSDVDRGWTVEIAVPWHSLTPLAQADGRALPPRDGDVWRMDFSRFNTHKHRRRRSIQAAGRGALTACGIHMCRSDSHRWFLRARHLRSWGRSWSKYYKRI